MEVSVLAYSPALGWLHEGACRDADPDLFFAPDREPAPERTAREARAKAVCQPCPVREACLSWALTQREHAGIWGGLTEKERKRLLRAASGASRRRRRSGIRGRSTRAAVESPGPTGRSRVA